MAPRSTALAIDRHAQCGLGRGFPAVRAESIPQPERAAVASAPMAAAIGAADHEHCRRRYDHAAEDLADRGCRVGCGPAGHPPGTGVGEAATAAARRCQEPSGVRAPAVIVAAALVRRYRKSSCTTRPTGPYSSTVDAPAGVAPR
jgi:hypothetical protein